jgi:hypothetical protein
MTTGLVLRGTLAGVGSERGDVMTVLLTITIPLVPVLGFALLTTALRARARLVGPFFAAAIPGLAGGPRDRKNLEHRRPGPARSRPWP